MALPDEQGAGYCVRVPTVQVRFIMVSTAPLSLARLVFSILGCVYIAISRPGCLFIHETFFNKVDGAVATRTAEKERNTVHTSATA